MKAFHFKRVFSALLFITPFIGFAQLSVTNGYTAQQLGNNLAGNNINVFNASITGGPQQYGLFQYTGNDLGLNSGVILSTGNIFQAVGPNSNGGTSTSVGGPGDADLTALAGFPTLDAVVFEFDFEVQGDEIEFNFVFLSEEYNEFVNTGFNDVFAFYISGPGITGQQNLAVVPGTTTPVTINTINNGSFWQFFNDNTDNGTNIQFDGFTTLMTARKNGLIQCGVYTLSLRIADGSDSILDSGVLLQENSLVQTNVSASSNTFSGNNTALEGCIEASFTFAIDSALSYDVSIPIGIGGSATNGVDYEFIDDVITISAGQLSSTLIIDAFADGLPEGQEVVELYFSPSPCAPVDTVYLYIDDYTPLEYNVDPTNATCFGSDNGTVDLSVSGGIAPYTLTLTDSLTGSVSTHTTFPVTGLAPGTYYVEVIDGYGCTADDIIAGNIFDAGTTFIPDGQGQSYSSSIVLGGFGAVQTIQSADQIQSICATLEHSRIGELEITLTAPNGQVVVLKEQPGGATCNMGEPCAVGPTDGGQGNTNIAPGIGYNYCWQAISNYGTMVSESNNFTYTYTNPCDGSQQSDKYLPSGSYQPYESFDNFIGAPLNGAWTITVTDEIPNNNGYIFDWSIVLQADPPDSVFTITEPVGPVFSHTAVQPACGANNGSINLTVTGTSGPYTYLWNNGATTQDLTGIPAGAYTVNVTDATSCTYTYQVNLSNNGTLSITGIANNQSCFGINNGAVNVTVSGATAPLTYSWSNGSNAEDLTGLAPGTYTITVQDGAGCTGVNSFQITAAPQINITGTVTNESCGDQEGTVSLTVFGAVQPVAYSWSNGMTTQNISELQQGTYTVQLTDANSCVASATFNVLNISGNCLPDCDLELSNSIVNQEICGNANGSINLSVFTTNGPALFSWSNGAVTEDLSGLSAGDYSVTITDNEGCQLNQSFIVNNQTGTLAVSGLNVTNEFCGNNQGAVDLSVSGGVQPYSYNWSNGSTTQDLSGLSAGTYNVTITDANNCSLNETATIQNNSGTLTQTYGNAVNEVCNNNAGSIDIQIAGGVAPYTYLWSNGATSQDQINLSEGTYSCVITDANGCSISTPQYVVQNLSGTLAINDTDVDNEVCSNGQGDIAIFISGGTAPYTFLWSNGMTTQNIAGLTAGTYSVTLTDNAGCSVSSGNLVLINESGTLAVTSVSTFDELCGNGTGSINISVTGGTSPITYLWNTGSTSQDLTNLSAGDYTCVVTDVNNCSVQVSSTVFNDPGVISVDNMVVTNEVCGQNNGAIDLIVSGASGTLSYLWSNGSISQDLNNIAAGSYSVQITDQIGCSVTGSTSVNNITNGLAISDVIVISEICGGSNGAISISVSGGSAPLTYLWSNGSTTEDLSSLAQGTYTCVITDNSGCELTAGPFTVLNSSGTLNANLASVTNEICGNNNGAINISVSGGTAPYIYSWSNGASTEDLNSISSGSYVLTVTDQNGCQDVVSATVNDSPGTLNIASVAITDEVCNNNQGAINIEIQGGTAPFVYNWSNGSTTQDLSGLSEGTFSVTVSDANGCQMNSPVYTVNNNSGNFDVTGINVTDEICGDGTGYIDLIVAGASGIVSYTWSTGATTQDLSNLSAGSYSGTATDLAGCTISFSASVSNEPGDLIATSAVTSATCFGQNGAINLTLNGGISPYTYLWSNGAVTEDITNLSAGSYTVNIADANGCTLNYTTIVNENGSPQITGAIVTDETCGNSDGSITLNVAGGTQPYTFDWDLSLTEPCCTYTLNMQDIGNSWNGASITVFVDGISQGSFTVPGGGANVGTFNVCTGSSVQLNWNPGGFDNEVFFSLLNASGTTIYSHAAGTAPTPGIIYTGTGACPLQNPTTNSVANLPAGTYNILVTDANGCQDSTSVVVNNSSGTLQINNSILVNETCSSANGSIELSVSGSSPITYSWSNGATTASISDLVAGTYTITITQGNGCALVDSFVIVNETNDVELISSVVTDESCGDGTGSINIVTSGGGGNLNYIWSNGFTAQNISGLAAGEYTVVISDGSECDLIETFTVNNLTGTFAVTEIVTPELCGTSNGSINLTITGGNAPYTILWSNNASSEDLLNVPAGVYTVNIVDDNGCSFIGSYEVLSNTTNGLATTAAITNDNCTNGTGAINLSVTGGNAPYQYNWSNGATVQDINGLDYGTYTVQVTDALGCSVTSSYNVSSVGNIQPSSAVITSATCSNSNGAINVSFSGPGAAPTVYLWSNGATTQDLSNIPAGTYWLQYTTFTGPGGGCTEVDTFVVNALQGTFAIDSIDVLHAVCSQNNGSLEVFVSGGTPGYTYSWSNGSTTSMISGLSPGTYSVSVSDQGGCTVTSSASISNFTYGFGVSSAIVADENCGDNLGAIDLTISGGVTPYTYSWSNGATTEDLSGLSSGTYTVSVSDANGCTVTNSFQVENISNGFAVTSVAGNETCGNLNGFIDLTVSNGQAPITYLWSNGATSQDLSGLTAGTFTCTITDGSGCAIVITEEILSLSPNFEMGTALVVDENCGDASGSITLNTTGGSAPLNYDWTLPDPCCSYTLNMYDLNNNGWGGTPAPGVRVTINGSVYGTFLVPPGNGNSFASEVIPVCSGDAITFEYISGALNGSNTYEILDSEGNIIFEDGPNPVNGSGYTGTADCASPNSAVLTDLSAGVYSVIVTDANGCSVNGSYTVLNITGTLAASGVVSDDNCEQAQGSIDLSVVGGTAPYTISWSNAATTEDISGLSAGTYEAVVTDATGCALTESFTVGNSGSAVDIANVVVNHSTCETCDDGSIVINMGGATAPYTYDWFGQDPSALLPGDYSVTITNADGCDTTLILTVFNSATLEETVMEQLNVHPNPSNGMIQLVHSDLHGEASVVLYDAAGREAYRNNKVIAGETGVVELNLTHLAPGTYHLKLNTKENTLNARIVIH
jgi:subtilisin-like proprotein convertase family protein